MPSGPARRISVSGAENSLIRCRQAPQGIIGAWVSARIKILEIFRLPPAIMAEIAPCSAQAPQG